MIDIIVNGQQKSISEDLCLSEIIKGVGLAPQAVIVEHNGAVLKPAELETKKPEKGDRLELIQIVGGG